VKLRKTAKIIWEQLACRSGFQIEDSKFQIGTSRRSSATFGATSLSRNHPQLRIEYISADSFFPENMMCYENCNLLL
jgi:hypothetical protein